MTSTSQQTGLERDDLAAALAAARPAAVRVALRLCDHDRARAEDLAGDVIARLWVRGRSSDEIFSEAYVVQCVRNMAIDHWRRRAREAERQAVLDDDRSDGIDDGVVDSLFLRGLLDQLPRRQRSILELRFLEDLPQAEVADRLAIPPGTVASSTARSLDKLRAQLGIAA